LVSEAGKGLIQGYRFESGDLILDLSSQAHVNTIIYRKQNEIVETIFIVLPGMAKSPAKIEDLIAKDQKRRQKILRQPFQMKEVIPQTVQRVDLDHDDQVIRIAITLTQPETLKVIENDHTHQFFIRLPKVDWEDVALDPEFEQIVSNYFVDQSHPRWSTLVFSMDRDLTILKREVINNPGQDPIFVLYLGQELGMRPLGDAGQLHMGADLSHVKEENPYEAQMNYVNSEKNIVQKNPFSFQTEKPLYLKKTARYKKGTTNYTDISRGPYMGVRAGYSASQTNMSMSTVSGQHSYDYQTAMTGINYGLFVGYGQNFDKFYAGAELFFDMNREQGRIGGYRPVRGPFLSRSFYRYTYGGALRLGMYAGPESMVYMRLGGVGTRFENKSQGTLSGLLTVKEKVKKGLAGYLYGFGMEIALDNHFSIRMDYDRITYQSFDQSSHIGWPDGANGPGHVKFGPKMDRYALGLSYKFNDSIGPNSPSGIYQIPTGFYLGTGLDMASTFNNRLLVNENDGFRWSLKSGTLTPNWMMHMGYGVQYGRYYAGAEISATFGTKFLKEYRKFNGDSGEYIIRMQPTAGLYLRGGYTFGHANMVYLKSGLLLSSFDRSSRSDGGGFVERLSGIQRVKKSLIALAVGGGFETFVSDKVSVRNEVMHEMYQKFSAKEGTILEKFSLSTTRYQLTMNYIF
jgi:hypothetical protein